MQTKKWYTNIWWLWLILTITYFVIIIVGGGLNNTGHVSGLVGLFVPIGFFTGAILLNGIGPVIILVIFGIFALEHHLSEKAPLRIWQKTLLALATLLIITMSIDFYIFRSWQSWHIFIDGKVDTSQID